MDIEWALAAVANRVDRYGWRVLAVGGWVRDRVIGALSKDLDVEVYGTYTIPELVQVLSALGKVDLVGRSFGVLKLRIDGIDLDVSTPRRENKAGRGHKGFLVEPDPTMTPMEAAARRDFTMNAMAFDPLSGEVLDFFGGREDLRRGVLRHVGPAFAEDPLRVLRGFQFCGRFGLAAAPETVSLCRALREEYETLPKERIWMEWEKWARKSTQPSKGLAFLVQTGWIGFYPELQALIGLEQDPVWHPEGSVWEHTKRAVDAMAAICEREGIAGEDRAILVFAALCHDLGKPAVTQVRDGKVVSPGHDKAGEAPTRSLLARIGAPRALVERVVPMVATHMRHLGYRTDRARKERFVRRLAVDLRPATIAEWALVVEADHSARPPLAGGLPEAAAEIVRLAEELAVRDAAPKPILMGRHLIEEMGWKPGPHFRPILEAAYQAQLDGAFSDVAGAIAWLKDSEYAR